MIWKLFSFLCCSTAVAATTTGVPQDLTPTWDVHLLVITPSQMILPWKGVTVQSDAVKYCFKAVQDISSILSLLDTFDSLSLVWLASFLHIWSFVCLPGTADTKKWWLKFPEEIIYSSVSCSAQLESNASFQTHVSKTRWFLMDQMTSLSDLV